MSMIKLKNLTPDIYYNGSRDFQLLGRLFDLVLNAVKTEADLLYNAPISDSSNDKLLDLLSLTLGFKANNNRYNAKQLKAICRVFPTMMKYKGSIKAVTIACNALFNAEGAEQALDYDFEENSDRTILNLYIPQEFGDITILNDLLNYILPAGMSCNIIREYRINLKAYTEIEVADIFKLYDRGDFEVIKSNSGEPWKILYSNNKLSQIPRLVNNLSATETTSTEIDSEITELTTNRLQNMLHTGDALQGKIQDNAGFLANAMVFRPETSNVNATLPAEDPIITAARDLITTATEVLSNYPAESTSDIKASLTESKTILEEKLKKGLEDIENASAENKQGVTATAVIIIDLAMGPVRTKTARAIAELNLDK